MPLRVSVGERERDRETPYPALIRKLLHRGREEGEREREGCYPVDKAPLAYLSIYLYI